MRQKKETIRKALRELNRNTLTEEYYSFFSEKLCNQIITLPQWQEAERIALYSALPDEPSLSILLKEYSSSKEFYLPRVEGEDTMNFYIYNSTSNLEEGSFGIQEPLQANIKTAVNPQDLDLIIIPGMAFTRDGIRLGRGKGYYDRYLVKTKAFLVGISFPYRILPSLPSNEWDQKMDLVLPY